MKQEIETVKTMVKVVQSYIDAVTDDHIDESALEQIINCAMQNWTDSSSLPV